MNRLNQCGAYLEHLQAEHHRLNLALVEIRHHLERQRDSAPTRKATDAAIDGLVGLLKEMRDHFDEEEEGGCLVEAQVRCQSVGPNVVALMSEHPQLARELERLIEAMQSQTIGEEEGRQRFEAFATKLKAHESSENRLVQYAFGGDESDYDVEGDE